MISLVNLERARPGFTTNLTGSTVEWLNYDQNSEGGLVRILEDISRSVWLKGPARNRAPQGAAVDSNFASRTAVLDARNVTVVFEVLREACELVISLFDYACSHKDRDGNNVYLLHPPTAAVRRTDPGRFAYWYMVKTSFVKGPRAKARRGRKA